MRTLDRIEQNIRLKRDILVLALQDQCVTKLKVKSTAEIRTGIDIFHFQHISNILALINKHISRCISTLAAVFVKGTLFFAALLCNKFLNLMQAPFHYRTLSPPQ